MTWSSPFINGDSVYPARIYFLAHSRDQKSKVNSRFRKKTTDPLARLGAMLGEGQHERGSTLHRGAMFACFCNR